MLYDQQFMHHALTLAGQALDLGEAPIGAIITDENEKIISEAYNQRESKNSPIAHAEIIAIEKAAEHFNSWRLDNCTIYVTLEPCLMCAGAIMQARLKRIVYGAYAEKTGALSSVANVYEHKFGYSPRIKSGVLEDECAALMNRFGGNLRS